VPTIPVIRSPLSASPKLAIVGGAANMQTVSNAVKDLDCNVALYRLASTQARPVDSAP
jgi:hypothetical protein